MELADIVRMLLDKKSVRKARKKFLKDLNQDLKSSDYLKNITYGNIDETKHLYEFQLMINPDNLPRGMQSMLDLKVDALNSNFALQRDMSGTVSELSVFINNAFRHNKLWVKCNKSVLKNARIDIAHSRVNLEDPRKFNPKEQDGLNFWIQFKVEPKVTVRSKK